MSKIDAENGLTVISKSLLKLAIDELRVSVDEEKVKIVFLKLKKSLDLDNFQTCFFKNLIIFYQGFTTTGRRCDFSPPRINKQRLQSRATM